MTKKHKELHCIEETYREAQESKINELMVHWNQMEDDLRKVITDHLETHGDEDDEDDIDEEYEDNQIENVEQNPKSNKDEMIEKIRVYLFNKEYKKAIRLCEELRKDIEEWKHLK